MKKLVCIILCSILLISVPFKGYASSAVFFGMAEEYVLAFLASLLGVQAVNNIDTSEELRSYNDTLYNELLDTLAGAQNATNIAYWITQAAIGNIDTSSVIWQKFQEIAISNYTIADSSIGSVVPSFTEINDFSYYPVDSISISYNNGWGSTMRGLEKATAFVLSLSSNSTGLVIGASSTNSNLQYSYTYNGKTVYYSYFGGGSSIWRLVTTPSAFEVSQTIYDEFNSNRNLVAWSMIYEGNIASDNIASYSDAFDSVLSSTEKSDIIDGSSVLQLYNPAVAQNGLEIVPDPENPNDIVIPAMLTADWYNFLKQFGSGAQQFVEAYNALNAAEGVSTGAINGLYNKLGIASAINSASAAAQGTLTLNDNNVFPQMSTVADAVTGVIPGALTPVTPDSGITNDSDQGLYKLPDLRDFFPFCIPFDLIDLLSCFVAEPETPEFIIALSDGTHLTEHEITLESFNNIASIVRTLELSVFILGLMLITRNLIRG